MGVSPYVLSHAKLLKVRVIARASTYVSLMCMSFNSSILHCNWIWWWYNAHIYLSTISPSMHIMIYVLIYSRMSKGLSLGELILAFYIIIFIPYVIIWECYMHCYINVLHVLDDLWDFHTKSLFLAFNIWGAEYPLSCFYCFTSFVNSNN